MKHLQGRFKKGFLNMLQNIFDIQHMLILYTCVKMHFTFVKSKKRSAFSHSQISLTLVVFEISGAGWSKSTELELKS